MQLFRIQYISLHALPKLRQLFLNMRKIGDHDFLFRQHEAFLPPFAVDAESVPVLPDEIAVSALAVHLPDRGRPADIFLGKQPLSPIYSAVHQQQSDSAQLIDRQLHAGRPIEVSVRAPDKGRPDDIQLRKQLPVQIRIQILIQRTGSSHARQIRRYIAVAEYSLFWLRNLASEPLCFEPGAQWNYSLCHDVLAAVVEVISGVRFGEYVKQNIFDPLGMKNSTFLLPEEEVEGLAAQYRFNAELGVPVNCGKQIQTYKLGSEYESGGAGCISTAEDYIKFLEALRVGDVILKKETIQLMATDRLNDAQKATYWDQDWSYGLGLRCPKENGKTTDFGWGGAAGAFLAVDIPNGLTLYYAQHMLSSPYNNRLTYESVLEEL